MIDINKFGLCAEDVLGTGQGECPITDFGDLKGLGLLKKGTKFNLATDTLDATTFRALITDGKLHQLVNSYAFEDTTPENERSTSSDGLMQTIREGKPMYSFTFKKGMYNAKAMQSLKGNNRWDAYFYFSEGLLVALDTAGENLKGFNGSMFDVDSYKFKQGNETEFSKVSLQLSDAKEFNQRFVFFTWDELGFNALEIEGVIETVVAFDGVQNAGDDITVTLLDNSNRSISYASLFDGIADWVVTVNGVVATISAVSLVGNVVNITTGPYPVATDVITVSLNGIVADTELKYYKSNTITTIVAV
jgi:hypothetical protein